MRDGVDSDRRLEAGLVLLLPFATTLTLYSVPASSPLSVAAGVALVTTTAAPPPTGVAVKVNESHGPPDAGDVAAATAWEGPVASAEVSVGAAGGGIVMDTAAEGGVAAPVAGVATTTTSYATPGASPDIRQPLGEGQVTVTAAPPPAGDAVNVNEAKGPPAAGALALSSAEVGDEGEAEPTVADLRSGRPPGSGRNGLQGERA